MHPLILKNTQAHGFSKVYMGHIELASTHIECVQCGAHNQSFEIILSTFILFQTVL